MTTDSELSDTSSVRARRRWSLRRITAVASNAPLRVQLVCVALLLVTLALVVVGFTATSTLRGYLLERVDDQLESTIRDRARQQDTSVPPRARLNNPGSGQALEGGPALQTAFFSMVVDENGDGTVDLRSPTGTTANPPVLPRLDYASVRLRSGHAFTTRSSGDGPDWRVLVVALPNRQGAVVVGTSLGDVEQTTRQLVRVNLAVSTIVLVVLGALAYVLVGSRLRRLIEVERTAERIAAGDLSQRVADADSRNEVGRLAMALNTMLTQIETSFDAQKKSEEQARQSEGRMRRFIGDASHELRTPLTSILGFAELFRQRVAAGDPPPTELISRIENEGQRMSSLVQDLLLLARLDQQRPLGRDPVDVQELVVDAVADAPALGPHHNVTFETTDRASNTPVIVIGDRLRLRQMVSNLLMNAYTHTPAGTKVQARLDVDEHNVIVEVIDNGPGLDATAAERVFERFYRADPSRTRASGGSGLGLAIVSGIVQAHSGSIELDTEPGRGARFIVRLPRVPVED